MSKSNAHLARRIRKWFSTPLMPRQYRPDELVLKGGKQPPNPPAPPTTVASPPPPPRGH